MKKLTHQNSADDSSDVPEEASENLRRYAEVVMKIYEDIKDTPAGKQLRLKAQWRKRFEGKNDGDVSHKE